MRALFAFLVACLLWSAPAAAQNMSLRAPDWAARLVASDLLPTTGGRPVLAAEGVDLAVRVTIAPYQGGVARVVRYEAGDQDAKLVLRRFTGHPSAGWWLYGPDTPRVTAPPAAMRAEVERLARAAISAISMGAQAGPQSCPTGARVFLELYVGGRTGSVTRECVGPDAASQLGQLLSRAAGSEDEPSLAEAARAELIEADAAFAARAEAEGPAAAFGAFAGAQARFFGAGAAPVQGREAIVAAMAALPAGTRMSWAPDGAQVSARGDMGYTWGRATVTPPDGPPQQINYVTVWTRDFDGAWKFAADIGVPATD